MELPPLRLSKTPAPQSAWEKIKDQWYFSLSVLTIGSVALVMVLPRYTEDAFTAKGSTQISVYWQRNEKVSPLTEAGKVDGQNITNLKNPSMYEFDKTVSLLSKKKFQKFMFYFSGHSNENGLHMRDGSITKSKFHELLGAMKSNLKIVILDVASRTH